MNVFDAEGRVNEDAAVRLKPYVRRTPTERSEPLGELTGNPIQKV